MPRPAARHATRWTLRPADEHTAARLSSSLRLHRAIGRTLAARGWEQPEDCRAFLDPRLASLHDPFELRDMDRAVDRTLHAIRHGERITVFGDYDVDGVSSTALMLTVLRHLGAAPGHFIPHRVNDGYGMRRSSVEDIARNGTQLLITVDTGVTAMEEVRAATALGMDVIVTDHHLAEGDLLPAAVAIVNPNRPDATYDAGRLCGVGVAFKFAHALLKASGAGREESVDFLRGLLDFVALGTIADVVPLLGENRVLARFGLERLGQTTRPGLLALIEETGLDKRAREAGGFTSEHIGFILGPRINAAGRTDSAAIALELLLTDDPDRARAIARQLEALNRERRKSEAEILKTSLAAAGQQMDGELDALLVVGGEDYHLGVVGIVAARLAEKFHRPAIVLRIDPELAKGSARSIPGFDIHEALCACDEHLLGYGGHAAAAGVQVHPRNVDPLREALNHHAREVFRARDLSPEIEIDADIAHDELTPGLLRDMQRLQPFGQDNPAPVFRLRGVTSAYPPRIVGQDHLKLTLATTSGRIPAIGFNLGELLPICESSTAPFDIVFRPSESTWRGETKLEASLIDARPCA